MDYKYIKYIALSLFLVVGVFFAGCTQQISADEIVKKMQEKYNSIYSMEGDLVTTLNINGQLKNVSYKFAIKKPNKYYMENDDLLIVFDGKTMYVYDKKKNQYIKTEIEGDYQEENKYNPDYGNIIKNMLKIYNITYLGEETYDNKKCYVLELTPKNSKYNEKIKIYVDEEYWQPLKIETNGMVIEYKNVKYNINIPDSKFKFTPPKGAKLVGTGKIIETKNIDEIKKVVSFKLLIPKYTAGLKLNKATLIEQNISGYEMESVSLIYGENQDLAIIEMKNNYNQTVNGNVMLGNGINATLTEYNGYTRLTFSYKNVVVKILSKLSKDEVIKIAKSMIE